MLKENFHCKPLVVLSWVYFCTVFAQITRSTFFLHRLVKWSTVFTACLWPVVAVVYTHADSLLVCVPVVTMVLPWHCTADTVTCKVTPATIYTSVVHAFCIFHSLSTSLYLLAIIPQIVTWDSGLSFLTAFLINSSRWVYCIGRNTYAVIISPTPHGWEAGTICFSRSVLSMFGLFCDFSDHAPLSFSHLCSPAAAVESITCLWTLQGLVCAQQGLGLPSFCALI